MILTLCLGTGFFVAPHLAAQIPSFTDGYTNAGSVSTSSNQITYAPHLVFSPSLQTNGPAEITNGTTAYIIFLSNSLGHTNMSDATADTGFGLAGAATATNPSSIPGIVDPPAAGNTNNGYYPNGGFFSNNQVWLGINMVPGTNTNSVTNYFQILALNGNDNSNTNWALTNLALTMVPPQPGPPHLEVRFYNSSTNTADDVYILPASTSFGTGGFGNGFWWTNTNGVQNWTNWIATNGN